MQRYFVSPDTLRGEPIAIRGSLARQLSRVMRLRVGSHIELLDDSGWAYEVELDAVTTGQVLAHAISRRQPQTEPPVQLVLYQALSREHKLDWVLQKGTELGVSTFVPIFTERTLVHEREIPPHRLIRWQRIVTEAAEQSGRAHLPQVWPPRTMAQACESSGPTTLALLGWVSAEAEPLGRLLRQREASGLREIRLFVGPEGGFTPTEVVLAQQAGIRPVSLGPRVLRTETAGMLALGVILCALGELG